MAQPATNPKIEELRFRLKTDPKNRIFYPLAEELRKVGQFAEAEQVLRAGLTNHPSYLSAWVSLGRVLRDQKNDGAAAEALNKALQLDPGNVVAARLLAETYLSLGEKVEAIKKYKLVQALLPADEGVDAIVEQLDHELNPPAETAGCRSGCATCRIPVRPRAREWAESPFAPEVQARRQALCRRKRKSRRLLPNRDLLSRLRTRRPLRSRSDVRRTGGAVRTSAGRVRRRDSHVPAGQAPVEGECAVASTRLLIRLRPRKTSAEEPASPWATGESHVFSGRRGVDAGGRASGGSQR